MTALADLTTYPEWLSLVNAVEPDGEDAWLVTLKARLGPLARSKRLRMRRVAADENSVRFERDETDGREHAPWVLKANVVDVSDKQCTAEVHLHYGGSFWSTPLELALESVEEGAAEALAAYLADG